MNKGAEKVWNNVFGNVAWEFDECGALLRKNRHGNFESPYGWTIDHINPNGGDRLENKRPLHWLNNEAKGDKLDGNWRCAVKARQDRNGDWHNYNIKTNIELT